MAALRDEVPALRDGDGIVSRDGSRRFVPYGEAEGGWWVEVTEDGTELPGLWEFWDDEGLAVCMCV